MSDYSTQDGASHRRGRHRNRGGKFRGPNRGPGRSGQAERQEKPSGFQKFLNTVTFGLLGKPKPKARPPREDRPSGDRLPRSDRPDRGPRPPRPPREQGPPAEVTTERLYVGNLSYDATESDLFELFAGVGQVKNAEVVVNSRTQRSKGFAFVTMSSVAEAQRAVNELNGKEFMTRPLQLSGAKPPSRGDRPGRRDDESDSPAESAPSEQAAA